MPSSGTNGWVTVMKVDYESDCAVLLMIQKIPEIKNLYGMFTMQQVRIRKMQFLMSINRLLG